MYEFIHFRVADVMHPNPLTVARETTVGEVQAIFEAHDYSGLPIVDAQGRLTGWITKLDVLKAFTLSGKPRLVNYDAAMSRPVYTIMNPEPPFVSPETTCTRALQRMVEARCRSFPVVRDDRLVGVVASEDILRAIREAAAGQVPARSDGEKPAHTGHPSPEWRAGTEKEAQKWPEREEC
jgi:CBS domain-containing protein